YSPTKIWMSPTARTWAKEHGMSEQEFARYLIARHQESGDPFANDVAEHPPGRNQIEGFEPQAASGFEGDVAGYAPGRDQIEGFQPESVDAFAGDVAAYPPGRDAIGGFEPELLTPFENDVVEKALRRRSDSPFPFE